MTEQTFQPGDVVVHKTTPFKKMVVVVVGDSGKIYKCRFSSEGRYTDQTFLALELEKFKEPEQRKLRETSDSQGEDRADRT